MLRPKLNKMLNPGAKFPAVRILRNDTNSATIKVAKFARNNKDEWIAECQNLLELTGSPGSKRVKAS